MKKDLYLADESGHDIGIFSDSVYLDADINDGDFDIELVVRREKDGIIENGSIVYIPGTEIGGFMTIERNKSTDVTDTYYGKTWRGMMTEKIVQPPSGQDYLILSGDVQEVIAGLINPRFSGFITVPAGSCGKTVTNFQVDRHCTLLKAIDDILNEKNLRLQIDYINLTPGEAGRVSITPVQKSDYSDRIEISQDYGIEFTFERNRGGITHIIGAGKGELKNRVICHYYADENGNISSTRSRTGLDEREYFFDYSSAESEADLKKATKEKLKELVCRDVIKTDPKKVDLDFDIRPGDYIGSREYRSGKVAKVEITKQICKLQGGNLTVEQRADDKQR